jgi:uncharacterized membrane protein
MPDSSSPALDTSARLALGACLALIVLGLGWELWWAPTGRGTLALKVLPLLAALPGLWTRRLYTYRWLSLALWAYVAEGCVRGASDLGRSGLLGWTEALLGLLLFVGCAWQVRAQLAVRRTAPTPSPA